MNSKFEGPDGRARLVRALLAQKIVRHSLPIAEALAGAGALVDLKPGEVLIRQGDDDRDVYFIVGGDFDVIVNGGRVNTRSYGEHLGEVAAFDPGQKRSATITATTESVVLKVSDAVVRSLAEKYPDLLEAMLVEANDRLAARNARDAACNERPHVLLVSASEGLAVLREVQSQLRDDDVVVRAWDKGGVFPLSGYPIPALQEAIQASDFVVAITQPDDTTATRGKRRATPRDNVVFETGMAIGAIGLERTILLVPSDRQVDLASDLNGLVTARYRTGGPPESGLAPAVNDIRKHIAERGPRR